VTVRCEGGRPVIEPFLTGLRDHEGQRFFGRPAGLLTPLDGSLLISDEENGAIYRVTQRR
jgi:glucose/arabinose dehydrogenase